DQLAAEPPLVSQHGVQAALDAARQPDVLGLLETLGVAQQADVGLAHLGHVGAAPLAMLEALPDLQDMPSLMDHPLGKMVLEAVVIEIFVLAHTSTSRPAGVMG